MTTQLCLYAPDGDFLLPYIRQLLPGVAVAAPSADGCAETSDLAVMISSCDIYGSGEALSLDEKSPVDAASEWVGRERYFNDYCSRHHLNGIILRCADIIGTGMGGFCRELARSIWRGTFFHFPGNEARRSCIHASDLAGIVKAFASAEKPAVGVYNVSDGSDPLIHDIAEALAFRMCNKRISNLSTGPQQRIGRLLYGKRRYKLYTTTRTFDNSRLCDITHYQPTAVCDYLRTHTYDDTSL